MNSETLSSKAIMLAITQLPQSARSLMNKGKNYDSLIVEILKYDSFSDDPQNFPTNKQLQKDLKLSPTQLRSRLDFIYEDFLSSMSDANTTLNFGNILVQFYVSGWGKHQMFCARLSQLPRVGDDLEFSFLRPIFQVYHFHVQRITHIIENDGYDINIWAKVGSFNPYEHFELEKAKAQNRYDWKTDMITEPEHRQTSARHSPNKYRGW